MADSTDGDNTKTIIVAGDWVVDEYWFLVRHESDISAHTGPAYYRSSNYQSNVFMELCGAGHVARVLYERRRDAANPYRLVGIGAWHEQDATLIRHLLHGCGATRPTFHVTHTWCADEVNDVTLIPIMAARGTTRVIRLYRDTDSQKIQLSRIDWEPPLPLGVDPDISEPHWRELPDGAGHVAIVIHDLCRGVVTPALVRRLNKQYPGAKWYVRSKERTPAWLGNIRGPVELLLLRPATAAASNPAGQWLRGDGLTRASVELLRTVEFAEAQAVIVLTDDYEVIARLGELRDGKIFCALSGSGADGLVECSFRLTGPRNVYGRWDHVPAHSQSA